MNRNRHDKAEKIMFSLLLAAVFTAFASPITSYAAGGWVDRAGLEIYNTASEPGVNSFLSEIGGAAEKIAGTVLGILIGPFITGVADTLYYILAAAGISMDAIIYGNVGGMARYSTGAASSMFNFGLEKGNVFGTVSMAIYSALLGTYIIVMIMVILIRLARLFFVSADPKSRNDLKSMAFSSLIGLSLMYFMPKIVDVLLLLRDYLLYGVMTKGTTLIVSAIPGGISALSSVLTGIASIASGGIFGVTGAVKLVQEIFGNGGALTLQEMYRSAYTGNPTVFNAFMYLASVILTIYFAFTYIAIAFSFSLLVIMFPFICILDLSLGGNRVKEWVQDILGLMIIPVVDAVLLLFPLTVALLGTTGGARSVFQPGYTLIQFILCASIIPARNFIRNRLNLGRATGLENTGIGAALAAVRLASSAARTVGGLAAGKLEGMRLADALGAKSAAAREEAASNEKTGHDTLRSFAGRSMGLSKDERAVKAGFKPVNAEDIEKSFEGKSMTSEEKNAERAKAVRFNVDNARETENELARQRDLEEKDLNASLSERQKEYDRREGDISALRSRIRADEKEMSQIPKAPAGKDKAEYSVEERANDIMRAKIAKRITDNTAAANDLTEKNRALKSGMDEDRRKFSETKSDYARSIQAVRELQKQGGEDLRELERAGGDTDIEKQKLFDRMATIDNYDLPEFRKNLSQERLAELRQSHAEKVRDDTRRKTALSSGGAVAGAVLGGTAGMFMGSPAMMLGTSAGMDIGAMVAGYKADRIAAENGYEYSGSALYGNVIDGKYEEVTETERRTVGIKRITDSEIREEKAENRKPEFVPNEAIEGFSLTGETGTVSVAAASDLPDIEDKRDIRVHKKDSIITETVLNAEPAALAPGRTGNGADIDPERIKDIARAIIAQEDSSFSDSCFREAFDKAVSYMDGINENAYYMDDGKNREGVVNLVTKIETAGRNYNEEEKKTLSDLIAQRSYEQNLAVVGSEVMGRETAELLMRGDAARSIDYDDMFTRSLLRDALATVIRERTEAEGVFFDYAKGSSLYSGEAVKDLVSKEKSA